MKLAWRYYQEGVHSKQVVSSCLIDKLLRIIDERFDPFQYLINVYIDNILLGTNPYNEIKIDD